VSDSPRGALRILLALGYGGGALLLLLLLTKDDPDALTARVGVTAASFIILGLVAAAGARLLYHSEPASLWGYATVVIAIVTFFLIMAEAWPDDPTPNETRTMVMIAISILLGGGSLVLSGEEDEGNQAVQIARRVALVALVALGTLTVLVASDADIGPRWFGIAAAVFLISALSLPVLRLATDAEDGAL
jgi:FtsH-binding integral membrane protein